MSAGSTSSGSKVMQVVWRVIGLALIVLLVLPVLIRGNVFKVPLWDVVFVLSSATLIIELMRRRYYWPLMAVAILVLATFDYMVMVRALPLRTGFWAPLLEWAQGFKDFERISFGWILRTIFAVVLLGAAIGTRLGKKRVMHYLMTLACLWAFGFAPIGTERMARSNTVVPLTPPDAAGQEALTAEAKAAVEGQPYDDILVQASQDVNRGPYAEKGQVVVVQFINEPASFLFTGLLSGRKAKANPKYIRGTFLDPCLVTDKDFMMVDATSVPCKGMPMSTTVVRVGKGAFKPLTQEWTVFAAQHSGEVEFAYNFPRGSSSFMNGTAMGKRTFRVWVLKLATPEVARK